jgi:hypothetical protein
MDVIESFLNSNEPNWVQYGIGRYRYKFMFDRTKLILEKHLSKNLAGEDITSFNLWFLDANSRYYNLEAISTEWPVCKDASTIEKDLLSPENLTRLMEKHYKRRAFLNTNRNSNQKDK